MRMISAISILCVGLLLAGCASLRKPDSAKSQAALEAVGQGSTLAESIAGIKALIAVYSTQKDLLESDVTQGGDAITNAGILGGIAAVASASADVFKVLGVGAGVLGTYDLRYKPAQQRQHYMDATDALRCISNRAHALDSELGVWNVLSPLGYKQALAAARATGASRDQVLVLDDIIHSVDLTYDEVSRVNRKLNDKLFAAVTTQPFGTIKDNLVKDAVAAQARADNVTDPSAAPFAARMLKQGLAQSDVPKAKADLQMQLARIMTDGATYKSDLAVCTATFLR